MRSTTRCWGYVLLVAAAVAVMIGCTMSSVPEETVERLERAPAPVHREAEAHFAFGMQTISGQRHGFEIGTGGADSDARQWAAHGLAGVPYRYRYRPGDEHPQIEVVAFATGIASGIAVQRDIMTAEEGHPNWLISRLRVPLAGNRTSEQTAQLESGTPYRALVLADLRQLDGPERARWRAIRNVLATHYDGRHGSFRGTVYLLECEPQIDEPQGEGIPTAGNRYLAGIRVHNAAGGPYLAFDTLLVVAEHDWDEQDLIDEDESLDDFLKELHGLTGG